jgi:hypothetical protein
MDRPACQLLRESIGDEEGTGSSPAGPPPTVMIPSANGIGAWSSVTPTPPGTHIGVLVPGCKWPIHSNMTN